jgi:hypothetical protein
LLTAKKSVRRPERNFPFAPLREKKAARKPLLVYDYLTLNPFLCGWNRKPYEEGSQKTPVNFNALLFSYADDVQHGTKLCTT